MSSHLEGETIALVVGFCFGELVRCFCGDGRIFSNSFSDCRVRNCEPSLRRYILAVALFNSSWGLPRPKQKKVAAPVVFSNIAPWVGHS